MFTITGLENKVMEWKSRFLRVLAAKETDLPRMPQEAKLKVPKISRHDIDDMSGVTIDVRQYVLNSSVLKRSLYPRTYSPMTAEDWAESDKEQANRPKRDQHPKGKSRRRSPAHLEITEEVIPLAMRSLAATLTATPIVSAVPASKGPDPDNKFADSRSRHRGKSSLLIIRASSPI